MEEQQTVVGVVGTEIEVVGHGVGERMSSLSSTNSGVEDGQATEGKICEFGRVDC